MKRFQDKVGIVRGAGMQKRQTREMLDRPFDQSTVKTVLAQEWGTDPTNVDEIRAITLCQNSERLLEAISTMGWRSRVRLFATIAAAAGARWP